MPAPKVWKPPRHWAEFCNVHAGSRRCRERRVGVVFQGGECRRSRTDEFAIGGEADSVGFERFGAKRLVHPPLFDRAQTSACVVTAWL
jgi:hypothetical protein